MKLYLSSHQLKLPNSLRGASYMVLSACFFAITAGLIRFATSEVHPFEAAFLRSFSGFLFMLPLVIGTGLGSFQIKRPKLHILRGIISGFGTLLWSSALALLPVGEAVALNFTAPLFTTIIAAFLLKARTVRDFLRSKVPNPNFPIKSHTFLIIIETIKSCVKF